ncbi:hypothetical protein Vi05172_g2882 [Venturia inaequalis]|nr:hypothetical protein Vi05172_g2882 [Venturia inaequalis]
MARGYELERFHTKMGGLQQTRMEQLRDLLANTNLDSTDGSVDPWLQQRLKVLQPHIIAPAPKAPAPKAPAIKAPAPKVRAPKAPAPKAPAPTPAPAPKKPSKKRPAHFVSLPSTLRRRIMLTALDLYGYEDQVMLKSLKKITEVEEDFDWVQATWFEEMGICEYCEIQFCGDVRDLGSFDTGGDEFDLQAFNCGGI